MAIYLRSGQRAPGDSRECNGTPYRIRVGTPKRILTGTAKRILAGAAKRIVAALPIIGAFFVSLSIALARLSLEWTAWLAAWSLRRRFDATENRDASTAGAGAVAPAEYACARGGTAPQNGAQYREGVPRGLDPCGAARRSRRRHPLARGAQSSGAGAAAARDAAAAAKLGRGV